jgi:hypothetical protein
MTLLSDFPLLGASVIAALSRREGILERKGLVGATGPWQRGPVPDRKAAVLVHKSGLISKKETALLDVRLDEVSYAKVEGAIGKALVVGVRETGGQILPYRVHVSGPASWSAQISSFRGGPQRPLLEFHRLHHLLPCNRMPCRRGSNCGQQLEPDGKFCAACGRPVT